MASVTKQTGKPRKDPKTGKELKAVTSYKIRWYYPVPGSKAEEQVVTWRNYADAKLLAGIIEARGGRVRKTDPDVLDRSIISGKQTRMDEKPFGLTVPQLIDEVIAAKVRDGIKRTSIEAYEAGNRAKLLREFWGDEYVSQLDEEKARALYVYVTEERKLDPRATMTFATMILNYGVRKGYLNLNPIKLLKMARVEFRPRFLAQEEFELLLSFVPEDDAFWLLLVTAWETGLRQGELLGLERGDITVLNGKAYITVNRTMVMLNSGKLTTQTPKSGKARDVVISLDLAERLLAPGPHPDRIFTGERNRMQYMRPNYVNQRFNRLRTAAQKGNADGVRLTGKPPRFHDLRHSHASNLLGAGVDMYVVSKRLGHSSITITVNIYGHLGKAADDAVLAAVALHRPANNILGPVRYGVVALAA